jgi:hypothetical protein
MTGATSAGKSVSTAAVRAKELILGQFYYSWIVGETHPPGLLAWTLPTQFLPFELDGSLC